MTVTLELKPEIEARVAEQAHARGLTVEAYIQTVLESLSEEPPTKPKERSHLADELPRNHSHPDAGSVFIPRIICRASEPKDRTKEQAWLAAHRDEYGGQWVALDGDRLLSHGSNLKPVADAALNAGVKDALVTRVEPSMIRPYIGI